MLFTVVRVMLFTVVRRAERTVLFTVIRETGRAHLTLLTVPTLTQCWLSTH